MVTRRRPHVSFFMPAVWQIHLLIPYPFLSFFPHLLAFCDVRTGGMVCQALPSLYVSAAGGGGQFWLSRMSKSSCTWTLYPLAPVTLPDDVFQSGPRRGRGCHSFWSRHSGLLALCRLGDNYRQIGKAHAALFLPCVDVFRVPAKKTIRGHFQFESNNTHYLLTNSRPLTSHNPRLASHLQTYTHTHTHHHQEQPPLPTAVR